ncbi:Uncharacterized protein QTN25_005006 [Entamoeba marina]
MSLIKAHVMVVGSHCVGKSALVYRLLEDSFYPNCIPFDTDIIVKNFSYQQNDFRFIVCNNSGSSNGIRHEMLIEEYKKSDVVLLCYSITDKTSYVDIFNYYTKSKQENISTQTLYVLVGTKLDIDFEREVATEKAKEYATKNHMEFIELSSKDDIGCNELYNVVMKELIIRKNVSLTPRSIKSPRKIKQKCVIC